MPKSPRVPSRVQIQLQNRLRHVGDIRPNTLGQLGTEVSHIFPNYMPEMLDIEVHEFKFVFPACPNHLASQAACKSSFKIDSATLAGEVCDDELRESNLG